jgi:hypothetical protein
VSAGQIKYVSLIECTDCNSITPDFRLCTDCGAEVNTDLVYKNESSQSSSEKTFDKLAAEAPDDAISSDEFLNNTADFSDYDLCLDDLLEQGEQPLVISDEFSKIKLSRGDSTWWDNGTRSLSRLYEGHLLITSRRLVCLLPKYNNCTQVAAIHYRDITNVERKSPTLSSNYISVETTNNCKYKISLRKLDYIEEIASLIQEHYSKFESKESRAVRLDNTINDIVSDSEEASECFQELAELFDDHDGVTRHDQVIAESDSLDEAVGSFYAEQQDPTSTGPPRNSDSLSTQPEQQLNTGKLRSIVKEADPKDVGLWAAAALVLGGPTAVAASVSTTLGVGALLLGGSSVGAYSSSNPESKLAQIDPIQTALNLRGGGIAHKQNALRGGYGAGVAITALEQIDTENISPEYADWVTQIDIDTVLQDARLASKAARHSPQSHDDRAVRLLGGAAGVAHSYVNTGEGPDLEELLDEDLYEETVDTLRDDSELDNIGKGS